MKEYKLIFAGPVGAGKTTAIRTVSNLAYHDGDVRTSDGFGWKKGRTTVGFDDGVVNLGGGERIQLYGTPGQERFRFMWDLLANHIAPDCVALVILIDNTRNYPFRDLRYYLNEFRELVERKRLVVVVTHTDLKNTPTIGDYRRWLEKRAVSASVLEADVRKEEDVRLVIGVAIDKVSCLDDKDITSSFERESGEKEMVRSKKVFVSGGSEEFDAVPIVRDVVSKAIPEQTQAAGGTVVSQHCGKYREENGHYSMGSGDEESEYKEKIILSESVVDTVLQIRGVKGAALVDEMGEVISSSFEEDRLLEFVGFVAGIARALERSARLGEMRSLVLKSPGEDNLIFHLAGERILCVQSENRFSIRLLNQQIDNAIQWGEK